MSRLEEIKQRIEEMERDYPQTFIRCDDCIWLIKRLERCEEVLQDLKEER